MDKTIFFHLPKTAGTSLHSGVLHAGVNISPTFNALYVNQNSAKLLDEYDCIYGHISFSDASKYFKGRRHLTLLRDPVERAISWYWYARNNVPESNAEDVLAAKNLTIEEFFSLPISILYRNISNRVVRQLGGSVFDVETPLDKMYEAAKNNILKFDWVGFVDSLDVDIDSLSKVLNIKIEGLDFLNQSKKDVPVSAALIEKIKRLNVWDQRLYDDAKSMFSHSKSG